MNICKNYVQCPIYKGLLSDKEMTATAYRRIYCEAGWLKCKRYLVKERIGTCPPDLLPNSFQTVDEIIAFMTI